MAYYSVCYRRSIKQDSIGILTHHMANTFDSLPKGRRVGCWILLHNKRILDAIINISGVNDYFVTMEKDREVAYQRVIRASRDVSVSHFF